MINISKNNEKSFMSVIKYARKRFLGLPCIHKNFFIAALINNDINAIKYIFGKYANKYIHLNDINIGHVTMIIQRGHLKAFKFLIDILKYDFKDKLSKDGTDLLDIAITYNQPEIIKILCDNGFTVTSDHIDIYGVSRLQRAIYANNFPLVKKIISSNKNIAEKTDCKGRASFHYAVICKRKGIFNYLVKKTSASFTVTNSKKKKAKKHKSKKKQDLVVFKNHDWHTIQKIISNNQDLSINNKQPLKTDWEKAMLAVNEFYKYVFGLEEPTSMPAIIGKIESYFFKFTINEDSSIEEIYILANSLKVSYLLLTNSIAVKLPRFIKLFEKLTQELAEYQNNKFINSINKSTINLYNYLLDEISYYISQCFFTMGNYHDVLQYTQSGTTQISDKLFLHLQALCNLDKLKQALECISSSLNYLTKDSVEYNKLIKIVIWITQHLQNNVHCNSDSLFNYDLYNLYKIYCNNLDNQKNYKKLNLDQIDNIITRNPFPAYKILGLAIKSRISLIKLDEDKLAIRYAKQALRLAQKWNSYELERLALENIVDVYGFSNKIEQGIEFLEKNILLYAKRGSIGIKYQQAIKTYIIYLISLEDPENAYNALINFENSQKNQCWTHDTASIISNAYAWIMTTTMFSINNDIIKNDINYFMLIEQCREKSLLFNPYNNLIPQFYQKWHTQIMQVALQPLVIEDEIFYWNTKKNMFCSSDETVYKVEISNSQEIYVTIDPKLKISEFIQECKRAIMKGFSTGKSNGLRIVHKKFIKLKMNRNLRLFTDKIYINEKRKVLINFDHKTNHKGIKRLLAQSGFIEIIYTTEHVYDIMPRIALGIDVNQTTENSNRILNNQIISYKKIYSQEEYQDKFGVPYNNRIILKLKTVAEYYIDKMEQTINHYMDFLNNLLDIKIDAAELIESVLSQIQKLNILLSDILENSQESLSLPYRPPFDDFDPEEPYGGGSNGGSFNQPESNRDDYNIAVLGSNDTKPYNDTNYLL